MPEQCALAAAATPHNHQRLATMDIERNTVEHRSIPESADEIVYFNDGFSVRVHEPKKKIDVNTALVTNIANKDCTTAAVVA